MLKKIFVISIISFLFLQEKELPSYVSKVVKNDSVYLATRNQFKYPIHLILTNTKTKKDNYVVLDPNDSVVFYKESQKAVSETFKAFGVCTKYERSKLLESWFPMLRPITPKAQFRFVKSDYHTPVFDASRAIFNVC